MLTLFQLEGIQAIRGKPTCDLWDNTNHLKSSLNVYKMALY